MPYDAQGRWTQGTPGDAGYGLLGGEDSTVVGLGGAAGLIGTPPTSAYPGFTPSQTKKPSQSDFIGYTPNAPMAQIQTPNYQMNDQAPAWQSWTPNAAPTYQTAQLGMERVQNPYTTYAGVDPTYQKLGGAPSYEGLMGGDYDALQRALQAPGEISAKTAYEQGQNNLQTQMGGRGLYGSSIMSNQARNALETPYMNALSTNAANAAAQRYGMQASDLQNQNQFNTNIYGQQMGENQAANTQGYNTFNARMNENLAGQGYGLEAQKANQGTYANLQGLNLNQAQGINSLTSADAQQIQGLMANQNLAQNSFGLDVYGQQMAQNQAANQYGLAAAGQKMNQAQNTYAAGVSDAARRQDFDLASLNYGNAGTKAQTDWENQQALEKMQYDLASNQYTDQQRQQRINEYLALAGRGQVTAGQNAATANANTAADAAQQQALWSNLAGLLTTGGLMYGFG